MKTKSQEKYERRQRLFQRRKHKPSSSIRHPSGKGVVPTEERCISCGKNTTNHHIFCNSCHRKIYGF